MLGLTDIISGIVKPVTDIIAKVVPDKTAAAAATAEFNRLVLEGQLQTELAQLQAVTTAQTDINKVEAANPHIFVAGGRPFFIWVCGVGAAIQFIVAPIASWIAAFCGHPIAFPELGGDTLMSLTFGLLGLGAYRSF